MSQIKSPFKFPLFQIIFSDLFYASEQLKGFFLYLYFKIPESTYSAVRAPSTVICSEVTTSIMWGINMSESYSQYEQSRTESPECLMNQSC